MPHAKTALILMMACALPGAVEALGQKASPIALVAIGNRRAGPDLQDARRAPADRLGHMVEQQFDLACHAGAHDAQLAPMIRPGV